MTLHYGTHIIIHTHVTWVYYVHIHIYIYIHTHASTMTYRNIGLSVHIYIYDLIQCILIYFTIQYLDSPDANGFYTYLHYLTLAVESGWAENHVLEKENHPLHMQGPVPGQIIKAIPRCNPKEKLVEHLSQTFKFNTANTSAKYSNKSSQDASFGIPRTPQREGPLKNQLIACEETRWQTKASCTGHHHFLHLANALGIQSNGTRVNAYECAKNTWSILSSFNGCSSPPSDGLKIGYTVLYSRYGLIHILIILSAV